MEITSTNGMIYRGPTSNSSPSRPWRTTYRSVSGGWKTASTFLSSAEAEAWLDALPKAPAAKPQTAFVSPTYLYPTPDAGKRELGIVQQGPHFVAGWYQDDGRFQRLRTRELPKTTSRVNAMNHLIVFCALRGLPNGGGAR